jgi:hypothetical protein
MVALFERRLLVVVGRERAISSSLKSRASVIIRVVSFHCGLLAWIAVAAAVCCSAGGTGTLAHVRELDAPSRDRLRIREKSS